MRRFAILWIVYATAISFVCGGVFFWATFGPQHAIEQHEQNNTASATATATDQSANNQKYTKSILERTYDDPVALYTFALTIFTALLASISGIQIGFLIQADKTSRRSTWAAQRAAIAAKRSAEIAYSTLIETQRAWIKIGCIDISTVGIAGGGLTFDYDLVNIPIRFRISNVGTALALKVKLLAQMVAVTLATMQKPYDVQRNLSSSVRNSGFSVGMTIFPDETFPRNNNEIWSQDFRIHGKEIEDALESTKLNAILLFYVVGFIDYTFPTDTSRHHQTGFVVELHRKDGQAFNRTDTFISADELVLGHPSMGMGWYAD